MSATDRLPRECSLGDGRPKVRYDTRAQAKAMARKHRLGEHAYKCRHCDYFHLASTKPLTIVNAQDSNAPTVSLVDEVDRRLATIQRRHLDLVFQVAFLCAVAEGDGTVTTYDRGFVGTFAA